MALSSLIIPKPSAKQAGCCLQYCVCLLILMTSNGFNKLTENVYAVIRL